MGEGLTRIGDAEMHTGREAEHQVLSPFDSHLRKLFPEKRGCFVEGQARTVVVIVDYDTCDLRGQLGRLFQRSSFNGTAIHRIRCRCLTECKKIPQHEHWKMTRRGQLDSIRVGL